MITFNIFNTFVENNENLEYKKRIITIRNALSNDIKINNIINNILHIKGDYCVKLRFCQAVSSFERENDHNEKKNKSTKIVSIFIIGGDMFKITSFTKKRIGMILRNHKNLILAKEDIIQEIEQCEDIMRIIEKYSS